MISRKDRLVNKLMGAVSTTKDTSEKYAIHVDFDNVMHILSSEGYNLANQFFENLLGKVLNERLGGTAVTTSTRYNVALILLQLAEKLHIPEEEIVKYLQAQPEQDPREVQEIVKKWRKRYYGSMSKQEREKLVNMMQDKLRPDILEQIRTA